MNAPKRRARSGDGGGSKSSAGMSPAKASVKSGGGWKASGAQDQFGQPLLKKGKMGK